MVSAATVDRDCYYLKTILVLILDLGHALLYLKEFLIYSEEE